VRSFFTGAEVFGSLAAITYQGVLVFVSVHAGVLEAANHDGNVVSRVVVETSIDDAVLNLFVGLEDNPGWSESREQEEEELVEA
jgi:hypothetical protein